MSAQPPPAPPRPAVGRQRRRARALALQTLYEADVSGHLPGEVLQRLARELRTDPLVLEYAEDLVAGVVRHRSEIDASIRRLAPAWPLEQISAVDRNLLRLGIFEAAYHSATIPVAVVINEAVELAKLYGTQSSGRFVNGVLGQVATELEQRS